VLTLKTSIAVAILAGTATLSAGAGYLVTKATVQANATANCPGPRAPTIENRSVPLGGPPLPTDQGQKW
jgi:hypothetical protein